MVINPIVGLYVHYIPSMKIPVMKCGVTIPNLRSFDPGTYSPDVEHGSPEKWAPRKGDEIPNLAFPIIFRRTNLETLGGKAFILFFAWQNLYFLKRQHNPPAKKRTTWDVPERFFSGSMVLGGYFTLNIPHQVCHNPVSVLLMEEILHYLGCIKPSK